MIDNFEPQSYPLECSTSDGDRWDLVIGWRQRDGGQGLYPVLAPSDGPPIAVLGTEGLRFRLAKPEATITLGSALAAAEAVRKSGAVHPTAVSSSGSVTRSPKTAG